MQSQIRKSRPVSPAERVKGKIDSKSAESKQSRSRKATGPRSRQSQIAERKPAQEKLRESEEKFRKTFYTSPDSININRLEDGMYVSINSGFTRIMGYSEDEIIGKTSLEMNIWEDPEDRRMLAAGLKKSGEVRDLEARFRAKDGKIINGLMSAALMELNGTPHIISITRDITERRQAEQEIASLAKFPSENPGPVLRFSRDGILMYANGASSALLSMWGCSIGDSAPSFWRVLSAQVLAGGENKVVDVECAGRIYSMFLAPISGEGYVNVYGRDVTERRQAQAAVRKSRDDYQRLFDNANDVIVIFEPEKEIILEANAAACAAYGFDHDELVGMSLRALTKNVDAGAAHIKEFLEGRPQDNFESIHLNKAGEDLYFLINRSLIQYEGREAILSINRDITERKRADETLREREARYRALFEDSPISLWEEDFSAVKQRLDALRRDGVENFEEYFGTHPEVVSECAALVRVLDVNKATMALHKTDRKEDLLKGLTKVLESGPLHGFQNELARIGAGATSFHWEGLNRTMDGRLIDVSVDWSASPGYEESLARVLISMIDITERKRAEMERQALAEIMQAAALTNNLQGFLGVMHQSLDRVLYAKNFFVVFRNPNSGLFEEVFSVDQYDPPMAPSSLEKSITSYVFRTGEPLLLNRAKFADLEARGEVELVGKNSVSWLGAPLKTPAGTIGVIAVQSYEDPNCYSERDKAFLASVGAQVSLAIERKQAEEKLEEERILLRTLIDSLPDRVYVMDQQGRKIVSNTADWQAAGGKSMEDVIGKTDLDTYPLELATEYWALDQKVMNSGSAVINHEEQGMDPDGNPLWLLTSKVPLRDGQGIVRGLVGVGHDVTARKCADARIERQVHRLSALRAIDTAISSSFDLRLSLNILLAQTINELQVDAAAVLVLNNVSNELEYAAGVGFRSRGLPGMHVKASEGYAGQALLERRTVIIPNLPEASRPYSSSRLIAAEEFIALFAVPLVAKGEVKGVMELFHRSRLDPEPEWLDFMEMLAGQAAIAVDSTQLFTELQRSNMELTLAYDGTIEGWSRAMDLRDRETEGHTQRVTERAVNLGRSMGLSERDLTQVRRGALLHDIGKMGVPDGIMLKPGPLTEDEWAIMMKHPALAYEMLAPIRHLQPAMNIPYCHHENWDGSGYPRGLKGEQIPLVARMFAVVDVFDALTSDRPYRPAWSAEKAREYIREQAGIHFDPQIVELFLKDGSGAK